LQVTINKKRESVMRKFTIFTVLAGVVFGLACAAWAYELPRDSAKAKYFYIYGPQGNPLYGAEDFQQDIYINVPKNETRDLYIHIYDPDTGDFRDLRSSSDNPWDTVTEFTVYGKAGNVLAREEFGRQYIYDRRYYELGRFVKEDGERVGDFYQFKLTAKGISGDDANLFRVSISPYTAEAFSYDITFRLLEPEGSKMYFYPQLPAGTTSISVENYDIDANGGITQVYDSMENVLYRINDSESGKWIATQIFVDAPQTRRIKYIVTKGTQKYAHAGIRVKDQNGNLLPIYFKKGMTQIPVYVPPAPAPKPKKAVVAEPINSVKSADKCNEFTFDGTRSYDPDSQKLSFRWDFGDGTFSTEPVVTHEYKKAGEYKVTLAVKDDSGLDCDTMVTSESVNVNMAPVPAFSALDKACVDQDIMFDASATRDDPADKLSYMWNFGDSDTAKGQNVTKKYKKGGDYKVTLVVDDNKKTVCSTASTQKSIYVNTPPVANAGKNIEKYITADQQYDIVFDASKSSDADGDMLTYMWDFGDGAKVQGESVVHTYKKGGLYSAILTVDDGSNTSCSSDTDAITIKLNKQPVAKAGDDINYCVGTDILFDGSGSYDDDGDAISYVWNFGDGQTAEGIKVSHSYAKGGKYTAVLTVDDGNKTPVSVASDSVIIYANARPQAALKDISTSCVGTAVMFDGSDSRDPDGNTLKYVWDFGDGTVKEGAAREAHAYSKGGTYKVNLLVNDMKNSQCSLSSVVKYVKINTPPVADAGLNLVCCLGTDSVFDGSHSSDADGDKLSYVWNFGDGGAAEGVRVTHIYTSRGKYLVTLTVNDGSGTACDTSVDSFDAVVNESPVAVIDIR